MKDSGMNGEKYIRIEIDGDGNCMYYTAGHYFMYFLRNLPDEKAKEIALNLFDKLELNSNQQECLLKYIADSRQGRRPFTLNEEKNINAILGDACRRATVKAVFHDFTNDPKSFLATAELTYQAANICTDLAAKMTDVPELFPKQRQEKPDHILENAEINKIPEITERLTTFLEKELQKPEFFEKYKSTLEDEKIQKPDEQESFLSELALKRLLMDYSVQFLMEKSKDEQKSNFELYTDKIGKKGNWGEDTGFNCLIRHISGEVTERGADGRSYCSRAIEFPYAFVNDYTLHGHKGEETHYYQKSYFIHNSGNTHWELFVKFDGKTDCEQAFKNQIWYLRGNKLLDPNPPRYRYYRDKRYPRSNIQFELIMIGLLLGSVAIITAGAVIMAVNITNPAGIVVGALMLTFGLLALCSTINLMYRYKNQLETNQKHEKKPHPGYGFFDFSDHSDWEDIPAELTDSASDQTTTKDVALSEDAKALN